jgi:hypothetical protein
MSKNKNLKKSPLKSQPLRQAGQSLDEKIQDIANEKIIFYLMTCFLLTFVVVTQWTSLYFNTPPSPIFWSIVWIAVVAYSCLKIIPALKEISNYKLGRDGERAIGQHLETLIGKGYHVFHDLIDDGFNLDHIVIGPAGAFTIETKTWRKPEKGKAIIDYDGEKIYMNGFSPTRNPIIQAKAQKKWLQMLIVKTSGVKIEVKPVVVYPGWFINGTQKDSEVWVLEPKALLKYINKEKQKLSQKDSDQIAFQISRHLRAKEAK